MPVVQAEPEEAGQRQQSRREEEEEGERERVRVRRSWRGKSKGCSKWQHKGWAASTSNGKRHEVAVEPTQLPTAALALLSSSSPSLAHRVLVC